MASRFRFLEISVLPVRAALFLTQTNSLNRLPLVQDTKNRSKYEEAMSWTCRTSLKKLRTDSMLFSGQGGILSPGKSRLSCACSQTTSRNLRGTSSMASSLFSKYLIFCEMRYTVFSKVLMSLPDADPPDDLPLERVELLGGVGVSQDLDVSQAHLVGLELFDEAPQLFDGPVVDVQCFSKHRFPSCP